MLTNKNRQVIDLPTHAGSGLIFLNHNQVFKSEEPKVDAEKERALHEGEVF